MEKVRIFFKNAIPKVLRKRRAGEWISSCGAHSPEEENSTLEKIDSYSEEWEIERIGIGYRECFFCIRGAGGDEKWLFDEATGWG